MQSSALGLISSLQQWGPLEEQVLSAGNDQACKQGVGISLAACTTEPLGSAGSLCWEPVCIVAVQQC